ncbi:MAG: ATP-binding protein [Desulfitobacterium hafniense]|nr:ATP-binding protein [Desulfitobacterium hafniense]
MRLKRKISISIKLWLAMTLFILLVLGGLGFFITWLFSDFYLQQKLDSLSHEAEEISSQLGKQPTWNERLTLLKNQRLTSGTQLILLNSRGEILAIEGSLIGSGYGGSMFGRWGGGMGGPMGGWGRSLSVSDFLTDQDIKKVMSGSILSIQATSPSGQSLLIAAVPVGEPANAVVLLGSSPLPVQETIGAFRRLIMYSSLIATLLAMILSLFFARQVTRPLALMQKAARKMADGEFVPISGVNSNDELQELAESLNSMGESLKNHVTWLSQERNLLQGIIQSISDAVLMIDSSGVLLFANEPAKELWQEPGGDKRKEEILKFILSIIENPNNGHLMGTLTLGKQVLQVGIAPMQSDGIKGFVVVLRDVTASLRAEKDRREFMASVTHELRTPLHLIQGYLEAIQDGVIPADEKDEHIDLVLQEAKRLARLVNELQELDRLEHWVQLKPELIDLRSFMYELEQRFQTKASSLGIDFRISIENGNIYADRDRILQVFINLLDNALRHTPSGKCVKMWYEQKDGAVLFAVQDQGEGIPEEALTRVFEKFYRVDKARSRREGGMGLGLAIVKQIAEAHNGTVWVESQIGVGSTFWVKLPKNS